MRINAVAVIGLISFLGCNGEGQEAAPAAPPSAPSKTKIEPTPPQPAIPSPTVVIDLMRRQCDHNEDCLLVPSGSVCGDWAHEAINRAHEDDYRQEWRNAASECVDDTSHHAFVSMPENLEARCPGPRQFCYVERFEDESCIQTFVRAEEPERLLGGGDFMFRTDESGRYRITLKGDLGTKQFRVLDGDCRSGDKIIVTCAKPTTICEDNAYFVGGERHTVKTAGCDTGCDILVEYMGPSAILRR